MAPSNVLRVGLLTDVDRIDPRQPPEFTTSFVQGQVFDTLYSLPLEGRPPEPLLLASPLEKESDAGGGVYSAPLRPDVTFSDGSPLTAGDVVRSLESTGALEGEARVESRGDRVVFRLDKPNARFHLALTQSGCSVFAERAGKFFGTGPFRVAPDATPSRVHLERNPAHRHPVALDGIHFAVYPPDAEGRPESLIAAIEAGEVDFCNVLGREAVSRLRTVRKHILTGASTASLYFNCERPALADARVRRAIAGAIDRREVARISYTNPLAFAADGPLPPAMGEAPDGIDHDLRGARELLAAPGVAKPDKLSLMSVWGPRPYLPHPMQVADHLAAVLGDLGIAVEISAARDVGDYFRRISSGDADLFLSGWVADTPDPAQYLEAVLSSRAVPRSGNLTVAGNLSRYADPTLDAALEAYRAEPDPRHWQVIRQELSENVPLLPLMYGAAIFVHSFRVRNFTPSATGWVPLGPLELRD